MTLQNVDVKGFLSHKFQPERRLITKQYAILFALGIGFNQDPLKQEDFKYTLEFKENFTMFPSACINFPLSSGILLFQNHPFIPKFDTNNLLHAEEKIIFRETNFKFGEYLTEIQPYDISDKNKNAFFTFKISIFYIEGSKKELNAEIFRKFYVKGSGGFNFKGLKRNPALKIKPNKSKDIILHTKTAPNQAFIYRLCGDFNPLHVDPKASNILNFEKPILHGNCTSSLIAKTIVQELLNNNPERIHTYEVKFVGHLFPGESLKIVTEQINEEIFFEAFCLDRSKLCVIGVMTTRAMPKL